MEFFGERFLVEDAKHRVFAVNRRHDGNAEIDEAALVTHAEAAVLRDAALGDVQFAHDLDARKDRGVPFLGDRGHGVLQHAVNAVLDDDFDVRGLDVNVGGAALERREDYGVHEAHDRADAGIARQLLDGDVLFALFVFLDDLQRECLGGLIENALGLLGALQQVADLSGGGDFKLQLLAEQQRQLVAQQHLARIGNGDDQRVVLGLERHEVEAEHQFGGNAAKQFRIDALVAQIDEGAAIALRQALAALHLSRGSGWFGGTGLRFVAPIPYYP